MQLRLGMVLLIWIRGQDVLPLDRLQATISQQTRAISIGTRAGYRNQNADAIAIGTDAGGQVQGAGAIAIGNGAGNTGQHANAISIGVNAGQNQSRNCVYSHRFQMQARPFHHLLVHKQQGQSLLEVLQEAIALGHQHPTVYLLGSGAGNVENVLPKSFYTITGLAQHSYCRFGDC